MQFGWCYMAKVVYSQKKVLYSSDPRFQMNGIQLFDVANY